MSTDKKGYRRSNPQVPTQAEIRDAFDSACKDHPDRKRAYFVRHTCGGRWYCEINTVQLEPAGWGFEYVFLVIDKETMKLDEERSHKFATHEEIEAYMRVLKRDKGEKPLGLDAMSFVRPQPTSNWQRLIKPDKRGRA